MQWSILRRAFHGHTHARADRRPEAGDLRVPRRRRRHLPGGHTHGRPARHARTQPPQRRAPARRARDGVRRRRARRRADRRAPGRRARTRTAAARRAARRAGAGAGRRRAGCRRRRGATCRSSAWRDARRRRRRRRRGHAAGAARRRSRRGRSAGRRRRAGAHNEQARTVRAALAAVGVPAVVTGTAQRLRHPGAAETGSPCWRPWSSPRPARLRAAALTGFLGSDRRRAAAGRGGRRCSTSSAPRCAAGPGCCTSAASRRCWRRSRTDTGLPARLLARTDGERRLTDLRHVGQALHAARPPRHHGWRPWSSGCGAASPRPRSTYGEERSRRLESDAAAVQIITVHRSKGLEFPVVYVPFGWDRYVPRPRTLRCCTSARRAGARRRRRGGEGYARALAPHRAEEAGEDLRLLYVALTRAKCQVVTLVGAAPTRRIARCIGCSWARRRAASRRPRLPSPATRRAGGPAAGRVARAASSVASRVRRGPRSGTAAPPTPGAGGGRVHPHAGPPVAAHLLLVAHLGRRPPRGPA